MNKAKRLPQAPREPIAELVEFLEPFQIKFKRRESRAALARYLTGLRMKHPNKNCATLPAVVPETSEQQLQGLLTQMVWDEAALNRQRVGVMLRLNTEGDGALV